jgi:hypothetical protein
MFVAPAFTFFVTPLAASWSRQDEFAAEAFAAQRIPPPPHCGRRW